jgi:hypothetical protein
LVHVQHRDIVKWAERAIGHFAIAHMRDTLINRVFSHFAPIIIDEEAQDW